MFWTLILALMAALAFGQQESWKKPFPAHKIAGNLYHVGTEDLACFLITTPDGHILINSGLADSTPLIREGIQKLGYKFEDIRILLTMQAHFDHVAALAEIQNLTGARMYATEWDAPAIEDGGKSDLVLKQNRFAPIKVERKLKDGDAIRLGGSELITHLTPGHTKGSVSYSMSVTENGRKYNALIVNLPTVVMPLVKNPGYPQIADDFAKAFRVEKALSPDIWVAGHASQYDMQRKLKAGSFVDPQGYKEAVDRLEKSFQEQFARERRQP